MVLAQYYGALAPVCAQCASLLYQHQILGLPIQTHDMLRVTTCVHVLGMHTAKPTTHYLSLPVPLQHDACAVRHIVRVVAEHARDEEHAFKLLRAVSSTEHLRCKTMNGQTDERVMYLDVDSVGRDLSIMAQLWCDETIPNLEPETTPHPDYKSRSSPSPVPRATTDCPSPYHGEEADGTDETDSHDSNSNNDNDIDDVLSWTDIDMTFDAFEPDLCFGMRFDLGDQWEWNVDNDTLVTDTTFLDTLRWCDDL